MNFQLRTTEQHCVEIWVTFWRWLTLICNKINTDSYLFLWNFIPFVHSGHFQNMFHFLHCPMPSTCPPPLSTHSWHRRLMSFTARRMVPGFCRNTSTSCSILCCKSCRLRGGVTNTLSFRYPQRKKSHGVRSGDLGGHSTGWLIAITRSLKSSLRRSRTAMRQWAGAPSWAHQT